MLLPHRMTACSLVIVLGFAYLSVGVSALGLRGDDLALLPVRDVRASRSSAFGWKSVRGSANHTQLYTDGQGYRQLLTNQAEAQYITYFTIGMQTLAGVVDTGSYDLVVFSKACKTCGPSARYDSSLSSFYTNSRTNLVQSFGAGDTHSDIAWDQLNIGPHKDLNQTFNEVTSAQMPVLQDSEFNAIIGLGPPEHEAVTAWNEVRYVVANVSKMLKEQGTVDHSVLERVERNMKNAKSKLARAPLLENTQERVFSVCMGKELKSDGVFIWNDTSAELHPEIFHRIPVSGNSSWSIEVHNARISNLAKETNDQHALGDESHAFDNSTSVNLACEDKPCTFLIDTGTSLLVIPQSATNKLIEAIVSKPSINCSNMQELPYLVFEANGKTFSLPPDAYVIKAESVVPSYMQSFVRIRDLGKSVNGDLGKSASRTATSSTGTSSTGNRECELLVMESYASDKNGPLWIMGVPFFRKYYTTFDRGRTRSDRAIYLAGATEHCTPTQRSVQVHDGPAEMWQRVVDPAQLWMPRQLMLGAGFQRIHL